MVMIPFMYLTFEEDGLGLQQITEVNNKTKVLKVSRKRENKQHEFFEFKNINS